MALQTLDPLALSATKLQAGGMDAQEVAYKRKAMEDDLAKTQLALATKNKEIDQKQKEADQKLALMPTYNTLSQQHTKFAFEWMSKEKETRAAEELAYRQGLGGNPNDPTTPEGLARWNRTVNYGQIAANSKQMESTGSEWLKAIAAHPTWYKPNAKDEIYKWQTSTEPLLTGEVANMPQELFDLQGAIADVFGKIEKELAAGASADGTSNWSDEFIPSEAFLTTAEMFATEPNAQYALEQQFKEFTPEKQAQIKKDAAKYKTNVNTAMAMDAAKALYDRKREVRVSEQTTGAGYGIEKEKAASNELVQMYKGVVEGTHRGMTPKEAFKKEADLVALAKTVANNEALQPYVTVKGGGEFELKPGYRLITNLNRLSTGTKRTKTTSGGVSDPVEKKIRFAIQDEDTKNIIIVSGTDGEWNGGTTEVSEAISPSQLWSKVFVPGEMYTGEGKTYPIGSGELALRNAGINIEGTEANINPENKGAQYVAPGTAEKGTAPKAETPKKKAY